MAKYSEEFKATIKALYNELESSDSITFRGEEISSVRELIKRAGISSYTLYKWLDDETIEAKKFEKAKIKIDSRNPKTKKPKSSNESVFGTRFYQWFARALGLSNYAIPLPQLKLKIANKLANESGLVDK
jgi:transposase-like protein